MNMKKVISLMMSMMIGGTFSLQSVTVSAVNAEEGVSAAITSEAPDVQYEQEVYTTTASEYVSATQTTTAVEHSIVTYTTTADPYPSQTSTTTTPQEDVSYPYVIPFQLEVTAEKNGTGVPDLEAELHITHDSYCENGVRELERTTVKLTSDENGIFYYNADLEMTHRSDYYGYELEPILPKNLERADFSSLFFYVTSPRFTQNEYELDDGVLKASMHFEVADSSRKNTGEDTGSGTDGATFTTTSTAMLTTTTTTTTSTTTTVPDPSLISETTTTDTSTAPEETTATTTSSSYIRSTPYANISGFDKNVDIAPGESVTMKVQTFNVSDIIFSSDNEYITIDVKSDDENKYHSFVFGEKEFTISCAENAPVGTATVTLQYKHSLTSEIAEETIQINIVDPDAGGIEELPQTGYPKAYRYTFLAALMITMLGAALIVCSQKNIKQRRNK